MFLTGYDGIEMMAWNEWRYYIASENVYKIPEVVAEKYVLVLISMISLVTNDF